VKELYSKIIVGTYVVFDDILKIDESGKDIDSCLKQFRINESMSLS